MNRVSITLWAYKPSAFTGLGKLFCWLICLWTCSKWAHVGFSSGDKYYEADVFQGVVCSPTVPDGAVYIHSWDVITTTEKEEWLQDQIGKPYDMLGVLGFIIGPSKDGRWDRGHWFCSEIASARLAQFGIRPCQEVPAWEINPKMLVHAVLKKFDKGTKHILTSIRNNFTWH